MQCSARAASRRAQDRRSPRGSADVPEAGGHPAARDQVLDTGSRLSALVSRRETKHTRPMPRPRYSTAIENRVSLGPAPVLAGATAPSCRSRVRARAYTPTVQIDRTARRRRLPLFPATTIFALAAGITAFLLGQVVEARYPAQLVTAAAAGGAWIGFLWRGRTRSELLTLRLLLAANLYVFAFATDETTALASLSATLATCLTAGAIYAHLRRASSAR